MIDGLWAMRYAEFRIRPALETFYGSLTDAQKAQLAEEPQTVGSSETAPAATPAAICGEAVTGNANPFEPIQRALRPTDEQRKSLQMLYGASMEMAQFLTTTCPAETPSTPMARLDAASDRVMSLLHAAMNIEPMLGQFYAIAERPAAPALQLGHPLASRFAEPPPFRFSRDRSAQFGANPHFDKRADGLRKAGLPVLPAPQAYSAFVT